MVESCTLDGEIVRLEPLARSHVDALAKAGLHSELWRLQPRAVENVADMGAYVELALAEQLRGLSIPFVVVHKQTDSIIGSTRFMDIAPEHRRLEIGATWFNSAHQRTGANVDSKLLLLARAFDVIGVQKVVLKTEALNVASRRAILALGAAEEGTLRRHLLADTGRPRDMVFFSILDTEWPAVRERNRKRLRNYLG